MECFASLLFFGLVALAIEAVRTRRAGRRLREDLALLHEELALVRARLEGAPAVGADSVAGSVPTSATFDGAAGAARAEERSAAAPIRVPSAGPVLSEQVVAPAFPSATAADPAAPPPAVGMPPLAALADAAPTPDAGSSAAAADAPDAATAMPPPPAPPPNPEAPATPPPPPWRRFDWESLVGVKLFSWIAAILLALAAISFLRYSIEHGWLSPAVRMAIGLATGVGLLVVCELKAARRYAVTAQALDGAGIAILFSTLFAAHAMWGLLPAIPTFALMVLVTAVAVALAVRRDSLFIALLGLIGGFATPALLSTGVDRPFGLFGYLLLLSGGLALVGLARGWRILGVLALIFVTIYQWGWVSNFLAPHKLPLALGIFLVFPMLWWTVSLVARRRGSEHEPTFAASAAVGAALPLLFALYVAALPAYGERYGLLFGFLLLLGAGLGVVAALRGPELLHVVGAGATVLVVGVWLLRGYRAAAWPGALFLIGALVLLHLALPIVLRRCHVPLVAEGRLAAFAAPLLLVAFPVLIAREPAAASPALPFGLLLALLVAIAVVAIREERGALHFAAAPFAIAAEAVWSVRHLTPERLLQGVALYAVFGLLFLGVPMAARRLGRPLRPAAAGGAVTLAGLALLLFLAIGPLAASSLWGLALLLLLLDVGLLLDAVATGRRAAAIVGLALSWAVLGAWWLSAPLELLLVPALVVIAGMGVLVAAGASWTRAARGGADAAAMTAAPGGVVADGSALALVGHLFLVFVAAQARLALPPWPLLGALAVLDLALAVAALAMRRATLHVAGMLASGVVLAVLAVTGEQVAPWPRVAVLAALALVALALAWVVLGRRRVALDAATSSLPGEGSAFVVAGRTRATTLAVGLARAVLAAAAVAHVVAMIAAAADAAPGTALLLGAHLAALAALLFAASRPQLTWAAPASVALTGVAAALWQDIHAPRVSLPTELVFVGAIWAAYLAYPLVARRSARDGRAPWLAAVLASVAAFFVGRAALLDAQLRHVQGALPIALGIGLAVVLVRLLRVEREAAAERAPMLGRVALVAGAVLAAVTVAIPLQLDREWITIGWALLAAALAWLYGRVPHRGLLAWSAALGAVVFVRLALNPAVLSYHPPGGRPLWNAYLYTYLVPALSLLAAAWLLRGRDDRVLPGWPRLAPLQLAAGTVLLFLLVNVQIADFFSRGDALTFGFLTGEASLAEDLAYTLGWAIFAVLMLVAALVAGRRAASAKPARIAALALLLAAVLKGFLHDLGQLGGLYRVGSLVGLAVSLALVAVLLQRFVLGKDASS